MTIEELNQEIEKLELVGYVPYINRIDSEVVHEIPCETCGRDVYPRGIAKFDNNFHLISYRAFACCSECNNVKEF